ncbi:MAG: hypothetical protein OEM21_10025 [Nitrosopumilus sp.]|nr:hypothetical protein [Nitrosopumilus sp.]
MSTELQRISTHDGILRIKKLIQNNQGDKGRLEYIAETLQKGKPLFHSDQIYLNKKILADVSPAEIKKPTETDKKIKKVKRLISLRFGELGRLRYILQNLQSGKKIYHSDENYVELKTKEFLQFSEGKRLRRKIGAVIPTSPKPEKMEEIFYEPPTELPKEQSIIQQPDIPKRLQEIEEAVLSKQKESSDLVDLLEDSSRVNLAIDIERQKINRLKSDHEKLKVQRDELSQLIAYRQEYEIKINHEKEILEKEIKMEQEKVNEKDKLVAELIKNQSKIIQTKTEREVLMKQIEIEKKKSDMDLAEEQNELKKVKKLYEVLQDEIKLKEKDLITTIKESQRITGEEITSGYNLEELKIRSEELKEVVKEAEKNKDAIEEVLKESKKLIEEQNRIIEAEEKLKKLKSDLDES